MSRHTSWVSRIAGTLHLVALTAAASRDMAGMLDDLYDLDQEALLLSLTETSRNWGTSGSRADDDAADGEEAPARRFRSVLQ
ncbi:hypothetical protein [Streptomyces sp. NPDC057460]|uniref:hypothetical protein n=1 Tax=Streptomyces sp. NPDC057460 TaxID=3346141 RepID=UPI00369B15DD